jgi:hypothetical protein
MTNYTAPIMLLVGVAQHLVLGCCLFDKAGYNSQDQVADGHALVSCHEDGEGQDADPNPF